MRSPHNIRNNCGGRRSFGANRQMVEIEEVEEEEEEEEEEDSLEVDSTSSFSLQECIDEFRARRIRRFSTHSRDTAVENCAASVGATGASDADLINQNRCNKEQERKGKPCKNGFCYCFSSDSGGDATTRDTNHLRQSRRSRRSEYSHASHTEQQRPSFIDLKQRRRRHSAPSHIKLNQSKPQETTNNHVHSNIGTIKASRKSLTAISSLKSSEIDAPLIHIIQELHDNCVISEVHVNKQKLQLFQNNTNTVPILKKKTEVETIGSGGQNFQPTAPTMPTNISEFETQLNDDSFVETSSLENSFSKNSTKSRNRGAAGMLLKKRLSNTQVSFKPHQSKSPPPKPPRSQRSWDTKHSISSLASTTMSIREAERVLDDFLRKRGVELPRPPQYKRKSYPELKERKSKTGKTLAPMPSCPSLSDIERIVDGKKSCNYNRNLCKSTQKIVPKPKKEIQFGWTDPDPKITKMLNYDEKSEKSQSQEESHRIKTKFTQGQPQTVGWQIPHKISLDTVDGNVRQNLASNIENKETPIKSNRVYSNNNNNNKGGHGARNSQKFIWSEQLRNLSPWNKNKNKLSMRSSLKVSSKNFLQHSKKKILQIVSPKKDNIDVADSSTNLNHNKKKLRTIGVQTFEHQQQQTPPGSYHSPIQSFSTGDTGELPSSPSSPSTKNDESSEQVDAHFDFTRNVEPPSPPTTSRTKRSTSRGRKLQFPRSSFNHQQSSQVPSSARTFYRSYQTDLDQDVNLSKMGFLLSNIRSKLEASDNHAMKVFQDVERNEQSWDVDDRVLHNQSQQGGRFSCSPQRVRSAMNMNYITNEPIYSEIEEESVRISSCSQYDNNAGADAPSVQVTPLTVTDLNELYSKVNKLPKPLAAPAPAPQQMQISPEKDCVPLGTILHNSMKNSLRRRVILPDGDEVSGVDGVSVDDDLSYSSPSSSLAVVRRQSKNNNDNEKTTTFYQSLNNINEKNSPPKKNNNFSKSDLSLQRSEIFLENLCQNEIVLNEDGEADHLEKVHNEELDVTQTSDNVSYDLPEYNNSNNSNNIMNTSLTDNYLGLSILNLPDSHNQSTPKKQNPRYTSKLSNLSLPNHFLNDSSNILHQNEFSTANDNRTLSNSALAHYNHLKNVLQRSFRKGKQLFKGETRRLTKTTDTQTKANKETTAAAAAAASSSRYSDGLLDTLLADSNESLSPTEQLSRAVNICRNMPILEVSPEMVEAERLLLFSSLKRASKNHIAPLAVVAGKPCQCLWIDAMKLPIRANPTQDFFFNYYFICTFECNGIIKSTQSVECQNDVATFEDCGIEFFMPSNVEDLEIHCKIFMLRLRKISTLQIDLTTTTALEQSLRRASISASDSSVESTITSRFRQHANFTLTCRNFVPYKLIQSERCNTSDTNISLRSSNSWCIPINRNNKSSNLSKNDIQVVGRIEISMTKITFAGFLNVQDPKIIHNWNRRWCILDGLQLKVMQEMPTLVTHTDDNHIVLTIDLINCLSVEISPRDLCARPRSFFLRLSSDDNLDNNLIFLAAETQSELNVWLQNLSSTLDFICKWL